MRHPFFRVCGKICECVPVDIKRKGPAFSGAGAVLAGGGNCSDRALAIALAADDEGRTTSAEAAWWTGHRTLPNVR